MPYIPVDNICQAELFYLWDGQSCETVLHFEPDAQLLPTNMSLLGAHLVNWWDTLMQPQMVPTLSLVQVKLTDMTTEISPVVNYGTGLPLVGTRAEATLPNNVAVVITKRTALRGRSYRGRIYHPGMSEVMVTNNAVVAANLSVLIGIYDDLLAFVTGAVNWEMVVVSRYNEGDARASGVATPVTGLTSDGVIDSQRRRLPGRGS